MAQKIYVVEGRKFRTEADYQNALKDQQVIENLRVQTKKMSLADQKKLLEVIRSGRCRFHSILGQDYMEELSEDDKRTVARARRIQRFLSQPFTVAEQFTGMQGKYVPLKETIRGFKEIIEGRHDELPESAFLFAGTIDEVVEKAAAQPQ